MVSGLEFPGPQNIYLYFLPDFLLLRQMCINYLQKSLSSLTPKVYLLLEIMRRILRLKCHKMFLFLEIFHSVLTPSERTGDGAIALVSYEAASGALVVSLLYEGVADRRRDVNASLVIRRKNRNIYHAFFGVRSQVRDVTLLKY